MQLTKYLTFALLGATAAHAQTNSSEGTTPNGTIFDMVTAPNNTLGVSKFVGLLKSDSGYQPIIDLLQAPGNLTCFVPNDRVLTKVLAVWKAYAKAHGMNATDYPKANLSYNNISVADLLTYHVVGSRVNLTNLTDNVNVVNSVLNKTDLAFFNGSGLPILIENNATFAEFYNQTWMMNNSQYLEFEVGNGDNNSNVVIKDVNTTNGLLNVIDSILIPPTKPTQVIAQVDDTTALANLLKQYPMIASTLNNATNFTLLAPNNRALKKLNVNGMSNETIQNLLLTHVIPGVYYSTNLTMAAASNNGNVTATSLTNVTLPIYVNSTDGMVTINDTVHVTESNIFFNNGVMHVIDQVLNPPPMTNTTA